MGLDEPDVRRMLERVRRGARFEPPAEDPRREWWDRFAWEE